MVPSLLFAFTLLPPFFNMNVSVNAIKIHLWGKNRELPEVTMKAFEKLKETVTEDGLVLSLN